MDQLNKNISVIIPTEYRSPAITNELINTIAPYVKEIIIIDNLKKFDKKIFHHKNLLVFRKGNFNVNGAWNLGVEKMHGTIAVLLNDDVLFNPEGVFEEIEFQLSNKQFCLLGYDMNGLVEKPENLTSQDPFVISLNKDPEKNMHFGIFIAFKRANYYPLPLKLKIWYGDNLLIKFIPFLSHFKGNLETQVGKINFPLFHATSTTSSDPAFDRIKQQDTIVYEQVKREFDERIAKLNCGQQ